MYVALYTRDFMQPFFRFRVARELPAHQSFLDLRAELIREHGSALGNRYTKVLPAARISDLPDELENLDVN